MKSARSRAISYRRFSTPAQAAGDSAGRQMRLAVQWCAAHDVDLDERSFEDFGVSAHKGRNAEEGKLAELLELIRAGERWDFLLVENLDRISRQVARKAARLLDEIVDENVAVVTLDDGQVYTKERLDNDPTTFIMVVLGFIRANQESEVKSARIRQAWATKRKQAGKAPITQTAPAWLRYIKDEERFEVIGERGAVVQRIFSMSAGGAGLQKIANTLNTEKVPTFSGGPFWHRSYICKILDNAAPVGTFVPHMEERRSDRKRVRLPQEPIPNYFPSVVDVETYERVRLMRASNTPVPKARIAHMLAGLARCPLCGGSMKRTNKGGRSATAYYLCSRALHSAGCSRKSVRQDRVDEAIKSNLSYLLGTAPSGDAAHEKIIARIEELDAAISDVQGAIENAVDAITRRPSAALSDRLASLEQSLKETQQERQALYERDAAGLSILIAKRTEDLEDAMASNDTLKANALLRQLFDAVEIDYPNGSLVFSWKHSERPTSVSFQWPTS